MRSYGRQVPCTWSVCASFRQCGSGSIPDLATSIRALLAPCLPLAPLICRASFIPALQHGGGEKWLTVTRHKSSDACAAALHAEGFVLAAAVAAPVGFAPGHVPTINGDGDATGSIGCAAAHGGNGVGAQSVELLSGLDFGVPTALVFGNERFGLTCGMRALCDIAFTIPLPGLSESLNVSVAAAIAMHWGRAARETALGAHSHADGDLPAAERNALEERYCGLGRARGFRRASRAADIEHRRGNGQSADEAIDEAMTASAAGTSAGAGVEPEASGAGELRCHLTTDAGDLIGKLGVQLRSLGASDVQPRWAEHKIFFAAPPACLPGLESLAGAERCFVTLVDQTVDDATCTLFDATPDFGLLRHWFDDSGMRDAVDAWTRLHGRPPATWSLKAVRLGSKASRCRAHLSQPALQHEARLCMDRLLPHLRAARHCATAEAAAQPPADLAVSLSVRPGHVCAGLLLFVRRPPRACRGLAHKGLHHALCWGLARVAALQAADVVVDPCCGTAALLLEARESWPGCAYFGCDWDPSQLARASANVAYAAAAAATVSVDAAAHQPPVPSPATSPGSLLLALADGGALPLRDGSVDVILSDLPFGRQHGSVEGNLLTLYPRLLAEMGRVLARGRGRAVLLTGAASVAPLVEWDALASVGLAHACTVPLVHGSIDCALVLLHTASAADGASLFDWSFRRGRCEGQADGVAAEDMAVPLTWQLLKPRMLLHGS